MKITTVATITTVAGNPVTLEMAADGLRLRIAVTAKGRTGRAIVYVGRYPVHAVEAESAQVRAALPPGATHVLFDEAPQVGRRVFGITAETADAIRVALDAIVEADPDLRMERLIADRERLSRDYSAAMANIEDDIVAHAENEHALGPPPQYDTPHVRECYQRVAEFDSAHPDVVAELRRRRDERVDRFLERD